MPEPESQGSPGISPLNQKIHFSPGRKPSSCHPTPQKRVTRKLMSKIFTATEFGSCASKMGLSGTPWGLPQPCQSLQGSAGTEDICPKHILELLLLWSAYWRQALRSSGPAEVHARTSTAALGLQDQGKERIYSLLVLQKHTDFCWLLLPFMREDTSTRKLFLT